jgi:hypothetical protein
LQHACNVQPNAGRVMLAACACCPLLACNTHNGVLLRACRQRATRTRTTHATCCVLHAACCSPAACCSRRATLPTLPVSSQLLLWMPRLSRSETKMRACPSWLPQRHSKCRLAAGGRVSVLGHGLQAVAPTKPSYAAPPPREAILTDIVNDKPERPVI